MDRQPFFPGMGPRGGGMFVEHAHRGGWPDSLSWVIFALLLALLLVALLTLVLDLYHRSNRTGGVPALAMLDDRYARGQLARDAWLQARADLGGGEAPTIETPAPPRPPAS
jgi:uncharacterized membrane protein